MTKSKGVGRAHITHTPKLSTTSPGRWPPYLANPGFQVEQYPPTDADPRRMHQKVAGPGDSGGGGKP